MNLYSHFVRNARELLIYVLKSNNASLNLYNNYYKLKNKHKFFYEVNKRKEISIFAYSELSKPLPFYPSEKIKDSNFYGHIHSLKKYSNTCKITHSIEHGLYLGNYVPKATFLKTTKSILTFSENRKRHLLVNNVKKPIYPIGPYIHYADSILEREKIKELKEELGNTLLVFPSHSIDNVNVKFNVEGFISEILKVSKNYQTVMVCLYYKDILDKRFLASYKKYGFKIVTAGHFYDLNFISRLKSIILLSDFTMSNSVGTHTGYCIYLNKPHYIYNQDVSYVDNKERSYVDIRDESQLMSLENEKKEIISEFSKLYTEITDSQRYVIDKYWGLSSTKSPDEIQQLLE